jgi:hypothetical protein
MRVTEATPGYLGMRDKGGQSDKKWDYKTLFPVSILHPPYDYK